MKTHLIAVLTLLLLLLSFTASVAQEVPTQITDVIASTPVPVINVPLLPDAQRPGAAAFTLVVNGTGFVAGAVVRWNGNARTTTFVSTSQLKAGILATDVATAGVAAITVRNPSSGGTSNVAYFEIAGAVPALMMSKTSYATGSGTQAVASADLNGDGKIDVVVANLYSNTVTVFLGKGDGSFQAGVDYSTGANPTSVAVGDLNGDGKLDLAVATAGGPSVSVLLGNGDGTFQSHTEYPVGSGPLSLALGDFNRDGKLDIVTADNESNICCGRVSVLLGNGNGTFQPHVDYGAGAGPWSVAVADFNKDGKLDLAVVNYVDWTVSVLLGNGDGTFKPQVAFATGRQPISVAVGDLTGDGKLDLAVANFADATASVLRGNGDGTFQAHVDYAAGYVPYSVVMGDFNDDHKLDLAVANDGDQTVSVLLGNGDGTFQMPLNYVAGSNPQALSVGDFNRDGRLDLAAANYSFSGPATVTVLMGKGTSLALSINGLTFGTQLLGNQSVRQAVRVTNKGGTTLTISGITIKGANPQDFSQSNNCGSALVAGASCVLNVAFGPTAINTRTANLQIADSAIGSPHTVSLTGTGSEVMLNPNSLSFTCSSFLGHCSCTQSRSTTLTNLGSTTLDISSIGVAGPFSKISTTCGPTVGAGQSCAVTVGWSRVGGSGNLSFSDDGGASPQRVGLRGTLQCTP